MKTTATRTEKDTTVAGTLYLAFELSRKSWKLAFTTGLGQKPRQRTVPATELGVLREELAKARERFDLPANAPVVSCFEAGRDGFWLHRALSRWYEERFGGGGSRLRRIGIVALARKLLIALWRYVEFGEIPEGAVVLR